MSATDELRCPLDERRKKSGYPHTLRLELHRVLDVAGIHYWVAQGLTFWNCPDGRECVAYGYQVDGKPNLAVKIVGITDPEQAVEATLGRGTCGELRRDCYYYDAIGENTELYCEYCDIPLEMDWGYCPRCGRRIKEELLG